MMIICKRSQGDETAPYRWKLRLVDGDFEYIKPPPRTIISQSAFSMFIRLYDKGASSFINEFGIQSYPTIELDNVTTCSITISTIDNLIILQNNIARSINGIVSFLGVSLAARSGSIVNGLVSCSLGELEYPTKLVWSITMQPCGPGTAPAGAGGYTCSTCPSGTYSDGGAGVTECTPCPGQGVSCAGGLLVLLPGFARTQDNALTIDSSTELYPCWAIEGCWVNLNTSDRKRASNHTHGCLKGYGGPLCGVCSIKERYAQSGGVCVPCLDEMLNLVVVSFIPLIVSLIVVWISFYRKVEESSKTQILFRIILTYFQTLGTLSSIYSARGTAQFRAMFGFTTAVGDSPLTLTPVQCTLRLPYYVRFGITISLPFSIAVLVLLANLIALARARFKDANKALSNTTSRVNNPGTVVSNNRSIEQPIERGSIRTIAETRVLGRESLRNLAETRVLAVAQEAQGYFAQLRDDIIRFFVSQAWVAPVIFVLNASYSSLTTTCFSMFNCMPFSVGGTTYLAQDLSVSCYDQIHNGFRALAGLLIAFFGAGFPFLFAKLLNRHKDELQKPEVFARLGFLYDGYTVERGMYMWESVVMVRKAAVVMIGSLIKDEYRQIFAAVTLLVFSLFLQANFQPYETRLFNIIECVSLVTIIMTQLISMFYLRTESQMKQCMGESDVFVIDLQGTTCAQVKASASVNDLFTTILLALVNLIFILGCLTLMYKFYKETSTRTRSNSLFARSLRRVRKRLAEYCCGGNKGKPSSSSDRSSTVNLLSSIENDGATIENPLRQMRRTNSIIPSRERERREEALIEVMSAASASAASVAVMSAAASSSSIEDDQFGVHSSARSLLANNEQQQENVRVNRREAPRQNFSPLPVVDIISTSQNNNNNDDDDEVIGRQESVQEDEDEQSNDNNLVSQSHSESETETQRQRVRGTRIERNRLPRNWIQHSDETGDVWFENINTGVIQWDLPRFIDEEETRERDQDQESINSLTHVWIRRTDDEDEWFENAADTSLVEWLVPDGHQIISEEEFEEMQARL
jgi:hypothetical protein